MGRQVDGEGAPGAVAALHLDAAAEELREGARDHEAEAGALLGLGERVLELAEGPVVTWTTDGPRSPGVKRPSPGRGRNSVSDVPDSSAVPKWAMREAGL
jgi:hypothetical protein